MVLAITSNQFVVAIDNVYYAVLDNPTKGLNAIDLCTLVMHILKTYAQISQPDLDDNMSNFHSGINSSLPLAIYMKKQEKCQVFAANVGVPISNKTMITTATKHALACGNMTLAWHKGKQCPVIDHTWPNWKAHWTAAFAKMRDINHMISGNITFRANQGAELKQAQQMASSLDNLANATIQKNTTIKTWLPPTPYSPKPLPTTNSHCTNVRGRHPNLSRTNSSCPLDGCLCLPLSLEQHQTCLGQGWILLDAWLQGQGWPHQDHMLIMQDRPSARHNPGKHHGWQHSQHCIPLPRYTLHLTGCTSQTSFHHHY
jgi:hypothetical protein